MTFNLNDNLGTVLSLKYTHNNLLLQLAPNLVDHYCIIIMFIDKIKLTN